MRNILNVSLIIGVSIMVAFVQGCQKDLLETKNNNELNPKLSDYNIFQGNQSDLNPTIGYKIYELSSALFTDYSEKQRLIKIPAGFEMTAKDNGLLNFPDGTILVKTFYYYNDKRQPSNGKKIIETRILLKSDSKWSAGTYLWNKEQTDANLIETGIDRTINWINESGASNVISYHVPSNNECASCHNSNNEIIPIGTKVRNMNISVLRNNIHQNQLSYFHSEGLLNTINPSSFDSLPNYKNTSLTFEKRARAYMEVNCAHCHNESGFASDVDLRFGYEKTLEETMIKNNKDRIIDKMESGQMPKLGTTVVDKESLDLIKQFLNNLN